MAEILSVILKVWLSTGLVMQEQG